MQDVGRGWRRPAPDIAAPNWVNSSYNEMGLRIPGAVVTVQVLGAHGRMQKAARATREVPMMDSSRRTVLTTGAAAAAATAAPRVFAQAPQATVPQGLPADLKIGFYQRDNVRIRYAEIGSGFPLLATPGGGLNSCIAVWSRAVINIPEEFKNDFRVITMDQRNATGGESTGPVPVDDPWGAFADDQLGLMDHLGIRQFFFFGNCIGGPFAMKLMERAPQRVMAAVLSQPVGHKPTKPDYMYDAGKTVWAKELRERQGDVSMETIEKYLHKLYRARPDFVYSVSRDF